MKTQKSLQVLPDSIIFHDLAIGESETMDIWAKNISKKPMKIRFSFPYNSPFSVDQAKTNVTPPGLEVKSLVHFTCDKLEIVKSVLKVECDDCFVEIPAISYPPAAQFQLSTTSFDLGTVQVNTIENRQFTIKSTGSLKSDYKLSCNLDTVKLSRTSGSISPQQEIEFGFQYRPTRPGKTEFKINFTTDKTDKPLTLNVKANVVDYSIVLKYEGKEIQDYNFGHVYFGQKKVVQIEVINKSPCKRSFIINPPNDPKSTASKFGASRTQSSTYDLDSIFSAVPCEGLLPPYEKTLVSIIFKPIKSIDSTDDIEYLFNRLSSIEVVETAQVMDFQLEGFGIIPNIKLSAVDFFFDYKKVKTKTSQTLTIYNNSEFLPITYEISQVAHFRFKPLIGKIPQKSSKDVTITFFPKNMGEFEEESHLSFCNGLMRKHINLFGTSLQTSDQPQEFKRTEIYETDEIARFNALHPDTRFGLSMKEINRNTTMRKQFDGYITDSAKKREDIVKKNEIKKRATQDIKSYLERTGLYPTDLEVSNLIQEEIKKKTDQEFQSGSQNETLKPPNPKRKHMNDNLQIPSPEKFGLISRIPTQKSTPNRKKVEMDDKVMVKTKFKPLPTTPPEINECSRSLSPTQQIQISSSHQNINFGTVSVFYPESRSFTITNNLEQYIFVEFFFDCAELKQSTPYSQVVPPLQTAGFDITFLSNEPQSFSRTVKYTVNKVHEYMLNISAQAIPIELKLSKSTVEFRFPFDYTEPFIKEYLTIQNMSTSIAEISWVGLENEDEIFIVTHNKGKIEPKGSYTAEFTFRPTTKPHYEQYVTLNVIGGPSKRVRLIGDTGKPRLTVNKKNVQFGLIPIGVEKTQKIRLKNTGPDDGIFTIVSNCPKTISISPLQGRIGSADYKTITFTVKCDAPENIAYNAQIKVCGANTININMTGQAELPKVELLHGELEFGKLFIGSFAKKDLIIRNIGQIPAALYLNLSDFKAFHIEFNSELSNVSPQQKVNSIIQITEFPDSDETINSNSISKLSSTESENSINASKEVTLEKPNLLYKITVMEQSEIPFSLVFQPTETGDFSFELPLTMASLIPTTLDLDLQPMVTAESIRAPLLTSASLIHFGLSPVFTADNPNGRPVVKELVLINNYKSEIKYRIESDSKVFMVDKPTGTITYSSSVAVFLSFKPNRAQPFNYFLPIYSETDEGEMLISKIQLTGIGTSRQFWTSTNYICLPIVPLNTKIEREIRLINAAFIDTEITVHTALNEKTFPLSITFPEGSQLHHQEVSKPILISFESSNPLSFSTIIALTADTGDSYSFTVSATTDNSVFTLYPFLSLNSYQIHGGTNKPIIATIDKNSENSESSEFLSKFLSATDYVEIENLKGEVTPLMSEFIRKILNSLLLSSPISLYPNDLVNSEGSILLNIINNLCGSSKKPSIKRTTDLTEFYDCILKFLSSCGAQLAEIKPEFLLPKEKFLHFMKSKIINKLLGLDYYNAPDKSVFNQKLLNEFASTQNFMSALMPQIAALDNLYPTLSTEAYSYVMMQIVKIFMISKCNVDKFTSISGVQNAMKELKETVSDSIFKQINRSTKNLNASNIFSPIESAFIKWLNVHYNHVNPQKPIIANDFMQMNNPDYIKAVIRSHLPKEKVEDKVSTFLKTLKMNFFPSEEEIRTGNMLIECFICYQLFQTLPRYYPTMNVEFKTELNKPIVQTVTISNTSKNEVLYTATLEGSPNFSFESDTILLQPSKTAEFPIKYLANTHVVESCKLILLPGRPRPVSRPATVATITSTQTPPIQAKSGFSSAMSTTRTKSTKNGTVIKPLTIVPNRNMILNSVRSTTSRTAFMTGRSEADSLYDAITPRREQPAPLFASPIVVNLVSNVQVNGPLKSIKMEGKLYEPTVTTIEVESPIETKTTFKVISKYFRYLDEYNRPIGEKISPQQQILDFLDHPIDEPVEDESLTQFEVLVKEHQPFIFSANEIQLPQNNNSEENDSNFNEDEIKEFKVEFNPISLGTYRCLVLFLNDDKGEFVYEIIAKATMPNPFVLNSPTIKTEAKSETTVNIPIDMLNPNVPKTIAYSTEKVSTVANFFNERKFRELLAFKTREVQTIFNQCFKSNKFKATVSSSQFFNVPSEIPLTMTTFSESSKDKINFIPVTFSPVNPGDYPNKIVLISSYDVRVYQVNAIGLASTNHLDIQLNTVAGREVLQEIPIPNPSNETWNYKVSLSGSPDVKHFNVKSRFSSDPNSIYQLQLTFVVNLPGEYHANLTVTNTTKEAVVVYKLTAKVEEPLAEKKIVINCRAREKYTQQLDLPPFAKSGVVKVTSTVPIMECPQAIQYQNRKPKAPFEFSIFALRNGVAAGTLTFTEVSTQLYCWFVIECHIESPLPEETIVVQTQARKTATIDISLSNPKSIDVVFDVDFNESDFFGPKKFKIEANSKSVYQLVFSPLKEQKRTSSISFYNDTEGEFIYLLDLTVGPPEISVLAPLECPIGKSATTSITLENPLPKAVSFNCENDNIEIFDVKSNKLFQLNPNETRQIDIVFIPGSVGKKETATVIFKSAEVGDYSFKLSGCGKPPKPLSPIIIESSVNKTNSGIINFTNPFRQPTKFTFSLNSENLNVFSFLTKKRFFVLNEFGQSTTIPFSFAPKHTGQFKANIIVTQDKAQWLFPIIGNATLTENKEVPVILGQSGDIISQVLKFPIVGEREEFNGSDYKLDVFYPEGYEFLSKVIELHGNELSIENKIPTISTNFKFSPKRPLNINIKITVENPLHQKWEFTYNLDISSAKPLSTISLECTLNKEVHFNVEVDEVFNERVSYRAYFAPGSASVFSVDKPQGYIEQSLNESTPMPFDVVFRPTMYGKVMKGLLVIDTLETQFLYEFVGLIPDYIPPVITWGGRIDNKTPESVLKWKDICSSRKKNFIKDNIESIHITRPKSAITITPRLKPK